MSLHRVLLTKSDGRALRLYSHRPIPDDLLAPSPAGPASPPNPHLRWHPLRGEWVAYASHRQNRTFHPPREYNPLAPMRSPSFPTELPEGPYEVAVFDNLFPTLSPQATACPELIVPTRPANGASEVVVFTQNPDTSLGQLPLDRIELLLEVWAERQRELGARPEIQYVMPFENRGAEMGVTLSHPHGQIYAYPCVPPIPARELEQQKIYLETHDRGLLEDYLRAEVRDGRRLLYLDDGAAAFVPACARYPYEVWVAPRQAMPSIADLGPADRKSFARALKTVLLKYDGVWHRSFPYLMVLAQAPTDGQAHPEAHFHVKFFPPYRSADRLKYLAGTELGAGLYANDSLPEEKAAELQAVDIERDIGAPEATL